MESSFYKLVGLERFWIVLPLAQKKHQKCINKLRRIRVEYNEFPLDPCKDQFVVRDDDKLHC